LLAEMRTGMRRREGREKAGRGRRPSVVPCWAAGFASGVEVGLGGVLVVVVVVLRVGGRRASRLLRCEMLAWFPAIEASRWSSAWFHRC
jgi:hypothetical protein